MTLRPSIRSVTLALNAKLIDEVSQRDPTKGVISLRCGREAIGFAEYHVFHCDCPYCRGTIIGVVDLWSALQDRYCAIGATLLDAIKDKARACDPPTAINILVRDDDKYAEKHQDWLRSHGFRARNVAHTTRQRRAGRGNGSPAGLVFEWRPGPEQEKKAEAKETAKP